jgi:DNA-binding CsgD family transcriptional regulator
VTADETIAIADAASIQGLVASAGGDLAGATHLLTRGLIATALAAWQLNEIATDANLQREFGSAQARRRAAVLQLATLPGRARLAAAAIRALPDGVFAVSQLRSTLFAFVEGSDLARSLLAVTLLQPWLRSLSAAFDDDSGAAADASIRAYGVPRLTLQETKRESRRNGGAGDGRPALSARERDVLCHIVSGLTTSEIAARLGVKSTTVSTLVGRIFNKLGVNNRPAAVAVALRYGLCAVLDEAHT